jgi:hypothetical protein
MRQRELGVRHIGFVSPRCREGLRRVEANVDVTRRALNGTIRGVDNGPGKYAHFESAVTRAGAQRARSVVAE